MSKIALTPNPSGNATFTLASPNTNTDRTLTLPDVTTTLVGTDASQTLTNKSIAASQLTGALPAIDGSALTGIPVGTGLTLLGTIATTSGSSVTLSGLTLTSYKQLQALYTGVSATTVGPLMRINGYVVTQPTTTSATDYSTGGIIIDLATGIFFGSSVSYTAANGYNAFNCGGGLSGLTTASTSITFTLSTGTFDAGSITIYGVK